MSCRSANCSCIAASHCAASPATARPLAATPAGGGQGDADFADFALKNASPHNPRHSRRAYKTPSCTLVAHRLQTCDTSSCSLRCCWRLPVRERTIRGITRGRCKRHDRGRRHARRPPGLVCPLPAVWPPLCPDHPRRHPVPPPAAGASAHKCVPNKNNCEKCNPSRSKCLSCYDQYSVNRKGQCVEVSS